MWYDVVKQSWRPGSQDGADSRWPRIGELVGRSAINGTVCDGYGSRQFGERAGRVPCAQCPGDPYKRDTWSVLQCSSTPLVPISQRISPAWRPLSVLGSAPRGVLLVVSDHNNHGLFAQVERVLNQLHLAAERGLTPHVFLGHKVGSGEQRRLCRARCLQRFLDTSETLPRHFSASRSSTRLGFPRRNLGAISAHSRRRSSTHPTPATWATTSTTALLQVRRALELGWYHSK